MLKGIDQRLSAELVHVLMLMGHGDDLVICDVNHPAATIAATTDGAAQPRCLRSLHEHAGHQENGQRDLDDDQRVLDLRHNPGILARNEREPCRVPSHRRVGSAEAPALFPVQVGII